MTQDTKNIQNRRQFIKYTAAAGITGLAGCMGEGNSGGDGNGSGGGGNGGDFPSEPITVIVPWAQGGGTDRSTRATTPTWSETLGADFVVENYPGGSTQVGGERLYGADPDGYTVAMWNMPQMQATWLFQDAPYGPDDFDYIGTHHWDPTMWFAPQDSPYGDMSEFLEYAETNDVTVGMTAAIGNTALSALLVQDTYDLDFNLVNLEGGTPTRQAILAGDVDAAVNQPWAFNPDHIGEVTPLGLHTSEETELWPPAPAFSDLGLTDVPLVDEGLGQWKLMVAPGGLEDEYPDRFQALHDSYAEVFEQDSFIQQTEDQGNLNLILEYNNSEATQEIVATNTEFMEEYQPLFDEV